MARTGNAYIVLFTQGTRSFNDEKSGRQHSDIVYFHNIRVSPVFFLYICMIFLQV